MVLPWYVSLICWSFKEAVRVSLGCLIAILAMAYVVVLIAVLLILMVLLLVVFIVSYGVSLVAEIVDYKWKKIRDRSQRTPLPEVDVWPGWNMIAELQPTVGETLERVIICDDQFDDPLYPHVSLIYIIGIAKHASFWRTFTIWRVSTVTGRREYVSHFNSIDPFPPVIIFDSVMHYFISFYSQNTVFIHSMYNRGFGLYTFLFVCDIRHKKWAKYRLCWPLAIEQFHPVAILCLGRKMKRGTVDGWRIRFLAGLHCEDVPRHVLTNFTIDLSASDPSSSVIIAQEDLEFPCTVECTNVRAEHQFGLIRRSDNRINVFVYHATLNRFQAFQNFRQFTISDAALLTMHQRGISMYNGKDPMVLNDREVIQATEPERDTIPSSLGNRVVMRAWVKAPTLRMAAVQSALKNIPGLARMKADQFRKATGVNLAGHLP